MTNPDATLSGSSLSEKQKVYADLLVRSGLNVQPSQRVRVRAELGHRTFAQMVVQAAYEAGAAFVQVDWVDPVLERIRLEDGPADSLGMVPAYEIARHEEMLADNWAVLSLVGTEYPNIFDDVEPDRMKTMQMGRSEALRFWGEAVSNSRLAWCVAGVPNPAWAAKVLPHLDAESALRQLWETVLTVCRVDQPDPVAAWTAHEGALKQVIDNLDREDVRSLRFFDPVPGPDGLPSTDLTVGLTDDPAWVGASSVSPLGVTFLPNIPTEEVFSTPHNRRTNGWVRISKPAFPMDREVTGMRVSFQDGEVADFSAEVGEDALASFFQIPGARQLGEVALVDVRSPINRSDLLFYNILFDENAVCHIAFGRAYAAGVAGGEQMASEDLAALGVNDSPVHMDVMIGTETMRVTGLCADGREIEIMADGRFTAAMLAAPDAAK